VADIRIHREHTLGLAKARKIAWAWAEEVESKFQMTCTVIEGDYSDTVEFKRSGVNGTLTIGLGGRFLRAGLCRVAMVLGAGGLHVRFVHGVP